MMPLLIWELNQRSTPSQWGWIAGGFNQGLKAAMRGPEIPLLQEAVRLLSGLLPKFLKAQSDVIGASRFQTQFLNNQFREQLASRGLQVTTC